MLDSRPLDWPVRRLLELCPRIDRRNDGGDHPVMTISSKLGFILQSDRYSREMAGQSLERYTLLKEGEFAYNRGNSITSPQGCIFKLERPSAVVPFVYYCFSIGSDLSSDYAAHAFRQGALNRELARRINSGVRDDGLLNISSADFFGCELAVPPLPEQLAIASILSTAEAAIVQTEALIESARNALNSTLDWFLRKSGHDSVPVTNFGSVVESTKYGTSAKCSDDTGGYPVLRIPNVLSGSISLEELKYTHMSPEEAVKFTLADGDLLAVRTNGNPNYVGRMALVSNVSKRTLFASYLIRIRVDIAKVLPEYVLLCAQTFPLRDTLAAAACTSAGNFNINTDGIRSAKIPLPTLGYQRQIVSALSVLRNRIDAEEAYLRTLRQVYDALTQELLSGRLRLPANIIDRHRGASPAAP